MRQLTEKEVERVLLLMSILMKIIWLDVGIIIGLLALTPMPVGR